MKLNLKAIGIGVGAVVGVLVLAAVLFIVFFPKDLAAREAERRVEEATGRDLVLGGEVNVTFWPALGFSVEQASLSNPDGFPQDEPFIATERMVFAVALLPLLRGDIQVKQLIFEGADLKLRAEEDGAANWTFPTEETPENQTTIEDLRLDDVRLVDSRISFHGAEGEAPLVLSDVDASLALDSLDQPAQLDAAFNYRDQRVTLEAEIGLPRAALEKGETPINASVRSDPLNASLEGVFNAETGALSGALEARGSSLRRLLAWIGSPMSDGGGFGQFQLTGAMAREGEVTALTDAVIRLDAIEARGNLTLINQDNGRLRVNGALNAPRVDLNTYLPAPAQSGSNNGVEVDTAWSSAPLDLSGLRALDAELNLGFGALKFQRMDFTDVQMVLRIANGAADARLTRISLYGGGGTARLIADGSGATSRIAVELNADGVQAEPLLRDAIGFDRIAGRGRLTASLLGSGGSQAAIMRSLRGAASFNFNDGELKGVNLAQVARQVQAALTGAAVGPSSSTDFAELSAAFTVADGVAATDSVRMLNPFVRLDGRGLINIGAQTIDMRIAPRAVNSAEGQGGDAAVAGLGIPFRITGPWSRVQFRPALEDVVQSGLRDILSRRDAGDPLRSLGEALFGRTPETPAASDAPAADAPAAGEGASAETETPAPPPTPEQRARNALEEALRRATRGRDEEREEAPAPGP